MVFGISAIILFITSLLFQNTARWKSFLISCLTSLIVFGIYHSFEETTGKYEKNVYGQYVIDVNRLPITDPDALLYYLVQVIICNAISFGLLSLLFNKRIISKNGNEKFAIIFILVFLVSLIVTDAAHAFLWAFGVTFLFTIISSIAYPNEWTKPKEYFVANEPLKNNEEASVEENIEPETTQATINESIDEHAKWKPQNTSSEKTNNGLIQNPEEPKEDFSKRETETTDEYLGKNDLQQDNSDTSAKITTGRKFLVKKEIKFPLNQSQKIIWSISTLLLFFVISYAFAEHKDDQMHMNETWGFWVIFIFIQTWLQNKIWNSDSVVRFTIFYPSISNLLNSTTSLFLWVVCVLLFILIVYAIVNTH